MLDGVLDRSLERGTVAGAFAAEEFALAGAHLLEALHVLVIDERGRGQLSFVQKRHRFLRPRPSFLRTIPIPISDEENAGCLRTSTLGRRPEAVNCSDTLKRRFDAAFFLRRPKERKRLPPHSKVTPIKNDRFPQAGRSGSLCRSRSRTQGASGGWIRRLSRRRPREVKPHLRSRTVGELASVTAVAPPYRDQSLNYIDRQILAAVEPRSARSCSPLARRRRTTRNSGWACSPSRSSLPTCSSPPLGMLADRYSRWKIVGVGVILWSIASGASGWEWGLRAGGGVLGSSPRTRCFVGVGEGAGQPAISGDDRRPLPVERAAARCRPALLPRRSSVGALGYAFGEPSACCSDWSWCSTHVSLDPARHPVLPDAQLPAAWSEHVAPATSKGIDSANSRSRPLSFAYNTLGMTAMTFAIGGLAF